MEHGLEEKLEAEVRAVDVLPMWRMIRVTDDLPDKKDLETELFAILRVVAQGESPHNASTFSGHVMAQDRRRFIAKEIREEDDKVCYENGSTRRCFA